MNKGKNKQLETYLSQVDAYLRHMPVSEKTDILSELKSTFYERLESGQSEKAILAEWGSSKELAMSYIGELIIENQGFSMSRLIMLTGFYSFASLTWVSIIPTLAILSIAFFCSSVISVFAGVMGLLKGVIHISLIENLNFMFFVYEVKGVAAFLIGLLAALVFIVLGVVCWKGAILVMRFLQSRRWQLHQTLRKQ